MKILAAVGAVVLVAIAIIYFVRSRKGRIDKAQAQQILEKIEKMFRSDVRSWNPTSIMFVCRGRMTDFRFVGKHEDENKTFIGVRTEVRFKKKISADALKLVYVNKPLIFYPIFYFGSGSNRKSVFFPSVDGGSEGCLAIGKNEDMLKQFAPLAQKADHLKRLGASTAVEVSSEGLYIREDIADFDEMTFRSKLESLCELAESVEAIQI